MKLSHPYFLRIVIVLVISSISLTVQSQLNKDIHISYTDSLENEAEEQVVSNNIFFTNNGSEIIDLTIKIEPPSGWRLIGEKTRLLKLHSGKTQIIPASFIKSPETLSKWLPVQVTVNKKDSIYSSFSFYLKTLPVIAFKVTGKETEFYVENTTRLVNIDYIIKNTGNLDDIYEVLISNEFLGVSETKRVKLGGGEEYNGVIAVKVSELMKQKLVKETIRLVVKGARKNNNLSFNVNRLLNSAKKNPSPYPTFPVEVETGILRTSNGISGYIGITGETVLPNGATLIYGYRSKQFGIGNRLEQNVFRLGYNTEKWKLYAGGMADVSKFNSFGQGFSVTHIYKKKLELGLRAIFHNRVAPGKNDVGEIFVKHNIKKIVFNHSLSVNTNRDEKRASLILSTEADLFKTGPAKMALKVAAGQDHFMVKVPGIPAEKTGTLLGYLLSYSKGKFTLSSDLQVGSDFFPGVYSGSNIQNHFFSIGLGKYNIGANYLYNKVKAKNFIFRDTVFNTTFFELNMERYSIYASRQFNKINVSVAAGKFRQVSSFSSRIPSYTFFDFSTVYKIKRDLILVLRTNTGYNSVFRTKKGGKTWISNSNGIIDSKFGGLRSLYVRTPRVSRNQSGADSISIQETMSIVPYLKFSLLKKTLSGNIGYSITKSMLDNKTVSYLSTNISYQNKRNGFDVKLLGNIPLTSSNSGYFQQGNDNFTLTIIKKINVPVPFKKKFHTLNVVLFKDDNSNKVMEEEETPVKNVIVKIGDNSFMTDKQGKVSFKNVKNAFYPVDLTAVSAEKGFIPADGFRQFPEVKGRNTTFFIAYQRGKLIEGRIDVVLDSFSTKKYTAEGLKVIVSDTSGNFYITLADVHGNFYLNVPAGRYKVSLNPEVFSAQIQPDQMAYMVEIKEQEESAKVVFTVRQRNRQVIYLKK